MSDSTRSRILEVMAEAVRVSRINDVYDADEIASDILAHLSAEEMAVVPGWQPIESAPKGDVIRYEPACYRKREKTPYLSARIIISNGAYPREATHWMPIPAPPPGKEESK